MKSIKQLQIWKDGTIKNGTVLNVNIFRDNLRDNAIFGYQILTDNSEVIASGELPISGDDYLNWTDNDYAWNYVASQLSIEFI